MQGKTAIVLKGYPRLSETFIAQEIRGLEQRGMEIEIVSLRHPTDKHSHPVHTDIMAPVRYLPEYLYQEPRRVFRAWRAVRKLPPYRAARRIWLRDLWRDRTPNRIRRFGQALVMAHELPADIEHIHVHFLHTPASVARYAAILTGRSWTVSAHAKDIWTTPDWEIREKLAACDWLRAQAGRLGIADRVDWLGALPQGDVIERYRDADLFALASRVGGDGDRDGLPNVLMEAQSQALACVATDVSAIPELIIDNETGLLVPSEDADALSGAIADHAANPERRLFLGRSGETRVRSQFSFDAGVDRLAEKFDLKSDRANSASDRDAA
jgi:hypothetical protein